MQRAGERRASDWKSEMLRLPPPERRCSALPVPCRAVQWRTDVLGAIVNRLALSLSLSLIGRVARVLYSMRWTEPKAYSVSE